MTSNLRYFSFSKSYNCLERIILRINNGSSGQFLRLVLAVTAWGVLLRLGVYLYASAPSRDACYYLQIGRQNISDNGVIPPLFRLLLTWCSVYGRRAMQLGIGVNLICGCLSVPLIGGLVKKLSGSNATALFAMLWASVNFHLIRSSVLLQREALMIFFILLSLWLCACMFSWQGIGRIVGCACSGCALALAMGARVEAGEFGLLILLWIFLFIPQNKARWATLALWCCSFVAGNFLLYAVVGVDLKRILVSRLLFYF